MSRRALRITLAATVLFALVLPAAAKAVHPAPYRLHQLKGDAPPALTVLESDFGGDYMRVAYVPAALSEQAAQAVIDTIPVAPQQELTFEHAGKTLKYLAVGDLSKPAKMILVYLHGFGDDRSQGVDEKRFGGNFARLKRLVAENDAIYLSPDFSGFGREAEDQVAALIADYAGRAPGAPVFVACISYGGSLCWRLAETAGESSPLRGILVFGAAVDRGFLKRVALNPLHVYVGIGTKDAFASWKSADAFFRDVKTAAPDYPIKLAIFDAGEHATAIRLTDWVEVLNWMLPANDAGSKPVASSLAGGPPCPRPRPGADGRGPSSYCGGKP
jgi:pimeloyl-ACP methyl ester carboxylesterase